MACCQNICGIRSSVLRASESHRAEGEVWWDAECEHLEVDPRTIVVWDHWPESWETTDLRDDRAEFLTGREACHEFAARLIDPEFVKATGGAEVTWLVAARITCPDKSVAKREFWHRVRDELFASGWDLLLCSAGSLSAVICEAARQFRRKAIDVGACDCSLPD